MSITAALTAALSGLRVTQAGMDVVATNVANAESVGYIRRRMEPVQSLAGKQNDGVRTGEIERVLDKMVQRQLRLETSGAAYTSTMADLARALDSLFGEPGSVGALDTSFNNFTQSLQGLAADPTSFAAALAEGVQTLRSDAEGRIASAVDRANRLVEGIADLNQSIIASPLTTVSPGLLDERDRLINELAQLMDVHVLPGQHGSVTITTTGGLTLFNGGAPVVLSFDGQGKLGPEASFSPVKSERGVGTITATTIGGLTTDVIGQNLIRSGEIGAAIALNSITLDYRDNTAGGVVRRLILLPDSGSTAPVADATATVIRVDMSGGFAASAAAIQAALASRGITVNALAGNTLQFLDDGAPNAIDVTALSADITVTQFDSGNEQIPFFVDSGDANSPYTGLNFTGFAQRLKVNPALAASRAAALVQLDPTTPQGDARRPQFLADALTKTTRSFPTPGSTGDPRSAYVTTVTDFARRLVEAQGADAEAAQRLDEGQAIALAAVEARMAEKSGVNVDQEMAQLVQLQTAYGANARIVTAIREMMDLLMRM